MRRVPPSARCICIALLASLFAAAAAMAADAVPLPATISPAAKSVIEFLESTGFKDMRAPAPDDRAGWAALRAAQEGLLAEPNRQVLDRLGATVAEAVVAGVPVLDIRPRGWRDDGRLLVYVHGGGFTLFSARSMAGLAALVGNAAGLRVISIDYAPAPAATWQTIQDQVDVVLRGLVAQGTPLSRIALWGDSAGGNLAMRAVLRLRDEGQGMPAAVVLFSPWSDLTDSGDTAITLRDADPTLSYSGFLANSARAYAGGLALTDARLSPLFADFSKGFPPTLIQDGTRTILLSTSVRSYRALKGAGADVTLDLYEGMWHVFQGAPAPEAEEALASAGAFLRAKLK